MWVMHQSWFFIADSDTDFFTSKLADSDFFFFKQQTRKNESIHKQDVYLVFNRPNWLLAIENNNVNVTPTAVPFLVAYLFFCVCCAGAERLPHKWHVRKWLHCSVHAGALLEKSAEKKDKKPAK